jgi:hypothetical protein
LDDILRTLIPLISVPARITTFQNSPPGTNAKLSGGRKKVHPGTTNNYQSECRGHSLYLGKTVSRGVGGLMTSYLVTQIFKVKNSQQSGKWAFNYS